jgi:MRVI1 protein.
MLSLSLLASVMWYTCVIVPGCGTVLQNKFCTLSLAFKTDKLTLVTRHNRQQRQRDQAERNMAVEIIELKAAVHVSMH